VEQLRDQTIDAKLQDFSLTNPDELNDLFKPKTMKSDQEFDPGSASSFIDQSIVDHKIQTSVITPIDYSSIAQTLQNPHPNHKDEIITV